jgi:SAM-dependent methyltransferase
MRISYRSHGGNRSYWQKRWDDIPADDAVLNLYRYPGRYAEHAVAQTTGRILEAGCGAGRVLIHFHQGGREIVGADFISDALGKIKESHPAIPLTSCDICSLPFSDNSFEAVLAFGLYHNLESEIAQALDETRRVMTDGGVLVASLRADNIQNRIIDWLAERGMPAKGGDFHKMNFTIEDLHSLFPAAGFKIEKIEYVENMPLLYKIGFFRAAGHKSFNEHKGRAEGYLLSRLGGVLQKALVTLWPASFCNIFVLTVRAT